MKEKKEKALEVAEKTGEVVGKSIVKGLKITKSIGSGLIKGVRARK